MLRSLKSILKVLMLLVATPAFASHNAGGDIQYEYISSINGTHKYKLMLRLYRDVTGITLPTSATVYACSSNYSSLSATLSEVSPSTSGQGVVAPTLFECVSSASAGVTINVVKYEGEITLPGNSSDWTFSFSTCCRNPAIDNIVNPSSQGFYIEAKLNNQLGQNTSPEFVSEPVRAFCVGRTFNWIQGAIEPDGDSLYYRISHVKDGSMCTSSNITYATGWTFNQPISTSSSDSLSIDPYTGVITFKPSSVEVDVMAVVVDEYRYDTTLNVWNKIGEINRDMQIAIASACTPQAQAGIQLDLQSPNITLDSISGLPKITVSCLSDSTFAFPFSFKLDCSTIASDGSDFILYAPNGVPIGFDSTYISCDVNNETVQFALYTDSTFVNGLYYIVYQQGTDSNVVTNKCGFGPDAGDTLCLVDVNLALVGAIIGPQIGLDTNSNYQYSTLFPSLDSTIWTINNGTIISGQGTNSVTITWHGPNLGSLSAWRYSSLGCNDTATLYISTNISVDEIDDNQKFEVYPNPTTEKVRINLIGDHFDDNSELNIELVTLTGEVIFMKTSRGKEAEFDLSLLPNGTYIFRIKTNQGMHMERVLKTK